MYDRAIINIKSGDGGCGRAVFHREKFIAAGGPDGGDGGRGGDIFFRADTNTTDLMSFKYKKEFKAEKGGDGGANKCTGKNGADIIINVPIGTIIKEENSNGEHLFLADLESDGEKYLAAQGGLGGLGNNHFATSTNQAPQLAQAGSYGQHRVIALEMKIMADAAIIGFPNAGKSSLLKVATNADPKIAPYPFTTLSPKLGIVEIGHERFILAEIPGLIKDAHQGKGLGHDFLRHIQRNRLLIHLIDATSGDPLSAMVAVNNELALYDADIMNKPQLVVLNKADLIDEQRQNDLKNIFKETDTEIKFISAATRDGVASLMEDVHRVIKQEAEKQRVTVSDMITIRPQERQSPELVIIENGEFVINSDSLERFVRGSDTQNGEVRRQLRMLLTKKHILEALKTAGAEEGSLVRCGTFNFKL